MKNGLCPEYLDSVVSATVGSMPTCHLCNSSNLQTLHTNSRLKDKDYCPIEIIKGLTDKGQFQYLTKLMGPQEGTYLYATQFHSLR